MTAVLTVALAVFLSAALVAEEEKPFLISSFEPGGPDVMRPKSGQSRVVQDKAHASDGEYCLRVEGSKEYNGVFINDAATLKHFGDYLLFKFDVFNPQTEPVTFIVTMSDSRTKGYGTKYNNESAVAAPGLSTIEINLTGLNRSNAKGNTSTDLVNPADLKQVDMFFSPMENPLVLFFDNYRLEGSGLPAVEGLRAIDFGPRGTPVYPGFVGCTDKTVWDDKAEFGWVKPGISGNCQMPDALTGDYGSGEAFKMKLPNGKYEIQTCFDAFGTFGRFPTYTTRQVLINGKDVLNQKMNGEEFLNTIYYAHEDEEDLPGQDLWEKFIVPRNKVYTFETEVSDGTLTVEVKSPDKHGKYILYLVAYPETRKAEGRAFTETLARQRKDKFNKRIVLHVPAQTGDAVVPTELDKSFGFAPFVRHSESDIACNARPFKGEIGKPIVIEAAAGQRCGAQIGLYPLSEVKELRVIVSDLNGPGGAKIPASAVSVKKIRNFFKRPGRVNMAEVLPYILQDFQTLDVKPGVTRGLWVTLTVPADAKPGKYAGQVTLARAGRNAAPSVAIEVTVLPFKLDKVTDITMSVTGITVYGWRGWYDGLEDLWWKGAELVMKDLADHGMNAVTGGPGAPLRGVKDGKAQIDYTEVDRWLDLAGKYGLTMPGDSYQGLSVSGMPRNSGPDCVGKVDRVSQLEFGIPFTNLARIVFGDFDGHMKEKGYPRRAHYLLDEPRPEWGNVQAAGDLIKVYTAASPETLFSGYYTTGAGRDAYFQTMPLSISHVNKLALKLANDAGKKIWEYDGERVRHNIGRWCYVVRGEGLSGYLRNGYIFVCTDPYFDFSDDEASWCVVYPSRHGINSTVGWERTAEGVTDYRYLAQCERLIKKARAAGKASTEADAADAFMKETQKGIDVDKRESSNLTPEQFDAFRHTLGLHIAALSKATGE